MVIRVEGIISVGRLSETWLENVEADMIELEINREDIRDRKKWRRNVMKRKSNSIEKMDYKPIIIIIITSILNTILP